MHILCDVLGTLAYALDLHLHAKELASERWDERPEGAVRQAAEADTDVEKDLAAGDEHGPMGSTHFN